MKIRLLQIILLFLVSFSIQSMERKSPFDAWKKLTGGVGLTQKEIKKILAARKLQTSEGELLAPTTQQWGFLISKSKTLQDLVEDIGEIEGAIPVALSTQEVELFFKNLSDSENNDLPTLIHLIQIANYLDVAEKLEQWTSIAAELIRKKFAELSSKEALDKLYAQIAILPEDIRKLIMIKVLDQSLVLKAFFTSPITVQGHTSWINSVAWSPDGNYLASGSVDNIKIWNVQNNYALLQTLVEHRSVHSVVWSPNGNYLASGSGHGTIKIWGVHNNYALLQTLAGYSVAWSPNGNYLAGGGLANATIKIWDVQNNYALLWTLAGHGSVHSVAWSPDGNCLASGSGVHIKIWDVQNNYALLQTLAGHGSVHSVAWSPDGNCLASGSGRNIKIWDVQNNYALLQTLAGHTDIVHSVAWSPNGNYLASGSADGTIKIWDVQNNYALLQTLAEHTDSVRSVAWSPNGNYLASGSWDKAIKVWDVWFLNKKLLSKKLSAYELVRLNFIARQMQKIKAMSWAEKSYNALFYYQLVRELGSIKAKLEK